MRRPSRTQSCKSPNHSFTKRDRLLRRPEFLAVTGKGKRISTRYFLVFRRPNREGRPRLGMIVSKKAGNAVKRNDVKRRVREFFRLHKSGLPASTDIVVVAKKGIPDVSYWDVRRDLGRLLKKPSPGTTKRPPVKKDNQIEADSHPSPKAL